MLKILVLIKKIFLFFKTHLKKILFLRRIKLFIYKRIQSINKKLKFYIYYPQEYQKFLKDKKKYYEMGGKVDEIREAILDFNSEAGLAKGHYFHQDLLIANLIFEDKPDRHIDIGSRIDGFVAHVASFREIEIMDIRNLRQTKHSNIKFIQHDIMNKKDEFKEICDSISSLHALEHFGLGRYNDNLDPSGHLTGFKNIINMLKVGGKFYISFPIGEKKTIFNQRRVFSYNEILSWDNSLELQRFDYVDEKGNLKKESNLEDAKNLNYGCGIYTFVKIK